MDNKNVKQPLTKFQLNNEIKTSFELGQVVPFFWRDTVPGDIFRNNTNFNVRFMPLIAPVMHKLDLHAHFYFVPYRLLDKNFRDVLAKPESPLVCKNLTELNIDPDEKILDQDNLLRAFGIHSHDATLPLDTQKITSSYFLRAYQMIYNYYFRHEILDDAYIDDMTSDDLDRFGRNLIKIGYARHGLDYFMSNLPSTQYGSMVELDMDNNGVIRVDEMRLAEKLQYFKERLLTRARGRYKNFLETFFGVSPTNTELQQPEYLGGGSQILNVSDVDQTATYEIQNQISPLGSQAGKINNNKFGYNFKYRCEEHGIILGLCWVLPRANYIQGVPREFIKQDFYSFYNPTFANLGMQETFGCELSAERKDTFGYNDRYAELKYAKDVIAGDFTKLSSWHFGIDLRNEQLSDAFVQVKTDNQPFAVKFYKDNTYSQGRLFSFHISMASNEHIARYESVISSPYTTDDLEFAVKKILAEDGYNFDDDNDSFIPAYGDGHYYVSVGRQGVTPREDPLNDPIVFYTPELLKLYDINIPLIIYVSYPDDDRLSIYIPKKANGLLNVWNNFEYNGSTLSDVNTSVVSNHILLAAYNNCDALRPIPKLSKPSISL